MARSRTFASAAGPAAGRADREVRKRGRDEREKGRGAKGAHGKTEWMHLRIFAEEMPRYCRPDPALVRGRQARREESALLGAAERGMTQTSLQSAADEIARALTDAWNAGDGAAFARSFTEDADFVNIFAMHVTGRGDIAKMHQTIFEGIYRGSAGEFTVVKLRPLGDDVIVALIKAKVDAPEGPMAGGVRTLITGVLVRENGGWRVASFQNTREQAPPGLGPKT